MRAGIDTEFYILGAMPRSKRGAARGRGKETATSGDRKSADGLVSFIPFAGVSSVYEDDAHSLHSEALQTQRHQYLRETSNQRLRHTKVAFVSAGSFKGSEIKEPETTLARMTLNETSNDRQRVEDDSSVRLYSDQDGPDFDQDKRPIETLEGQSGVFFVDSWGSEPVATGLSLPQIRSISPTISSSSDEVILFGGRDTAGRALSKPIKDSYVNVGSYNSMIRIIDDKIDENENLLAINTHNIGQLASAQPPTESQSSPKNGCLLGAFTPPNQQTKGSTSEFEGDDLGPYRHNKSRHLPELNREQEQALVDDYISNVEMHDMNPTVTFNQRDLGGTENKIWQATERSRAGPSYLVSSHEWGCPNLADFDFMSTSDEVLGSAQAILSKRSRKNGLQYLVVWEHCSVEEARWVPSSSLQDIKSVELIAQFEAEEKLLAEIPGEDDKTDSSTDTDLAVAEYIDASKDDTDLLSSRFKRISDEKLAELLAKQEKLGIGSSEPLLFDESPGSNLEDGGARAHHMYGPKGHGFQVVRNSKHIKGDFPAASDLADAYDGFDIMDFERPSLKKKPKGRKSRPAFDVSDSELEASMAIGWDKDSSRKRERKEERQALRLQGLLGKKDTKSDVKAKYKEGMGIHAVREEIKSFLIGGNSTLALPPMDKADRKIVHELANAFSLKSKSAGNGNKRFPVLYRTQRTSLFSEAKFSAIETRLTRRFLPRMDLRGRNSNLAPNRLGRGGASNEAVSYRDGDVVGGSAPELGIENRGRAMLEKMGWSTGTALGALNNKGILQPVSHVVKTSKAGLG